MIRKLRPTRLASFGISLLLLGAVQGEAHATDVASDALARGATPDALARGATPDALARGATGLPVPRFVSLKSDRVNVRKGPGTDYPTAWVFERAGLPVEILKEFDGWRQIRDSEGFVGWVQGALVTGKRTALIAPWDRKPTVPTQITIELRDAKKMIANPVALVEPGVIVSVAECDKNWCKVTANGIRGYIEQSKLWGVYPGETVN
jgi:SH3-like domain-containing protein